MKPHEKIHTGKTLTAVPVVTTNVTNQPVWSNMKESTPGKTLTAARVVTTNFTKQPVWRDMKEYTPGGKRRPKNACKVKAWPPIRKFVVNQLSWNELHEPNIVGCSPIVLSGLLQGAFLLINNVGLLLQLEATISHNRTTTGYGEGEWLPMEQCTALFCSRVLCVEVDVFMWNYYAEWKTLMWIGRGRYCNSLQKWKKRSEKVEETTKMAFGKWGKATFNNSTIYLQWSIILP